MPSSQYPENLPVICRVKRTSTQTLASGYNFISWNSVVSDPFHLQDVTNLYQFNIKRGLGGLWLCQMGVTLSTNTVSNSFLAITQNGTANTNEVCTQAMGYTLYGSTGMLLALADGDYITTKIELTSSGPSVTTPSFFNMIRVSE